MTNEEALELFKDRDLVGRKVFVDEAIDLAIEALEKQIPRKPIVRTYSVSDLDFYDCFCPNCSFMFGSNLNYTFSKVAYHHCICGQAMDWSEE